MRVETKPVEQDRQAVPAQQSAGRRTEAQHTTVVVNKDYAYTIPAGMDTTGIPGTYAPDGKWQPIYLERWGGC